MTFVFIGIKKVCETGSNARFIYGLTEMQGWRISEPFPWCMIVG